jgi:hypothetical protein
LLVAAMYVSEERLPGRCRLGLNGDRWWDAVVHCRAASICEVSVLSGSFLGSQTLRVCVGSSEAANVRSNEHFD